jgi:hypothetical protein
VSTVDVHQHLWPDLLVDRLRARRRAPYLRDWTLHLRGDAPRDVDPAAHDVALRVARDRDEGVDRACLSLSSALGIEELAPPEATLLLAAWHSGVRALPGHFRAWASVAAVDPDLDGLAALLAEGLVGVQVPATSLASPAGWERSGPVLRTAEAAGAAVLVHPGPEPRRPLAGPVPAWWSPVVGHPAQLQAAWWAWQAVHGREMFPSLRVLFAAGAGLAPVLHERHVAHGGEARRIDRDLFMDTSGSGPQALDALVRVLGIDVLAFGSGRPDVVPLPRAALERSFGDAATHAIRTVNPGRLLDPGPRPHTAPEHSHREGRTWPRAS